MGKWIFFVFLAFLMQTQLSIFNYQLNITAALVYIFAIKNLPRESFRHSWGYASGRAEIKNTAFGAAVGLIDDVISGSIIGPNLISKGLIGFISTYAFSGLLFKWTPLLGGGAIVIFTLLDGAMITGMRIFFSDVRINIFDLLQGVIIQTIFNAPFGIIIRPKPL